MNCTFINNKTLYSCVPVKSIYGEDALEISTAFSFADGTAITVYMIEQDSHVLFSDNGEGILHLSSRGFNIAPKSISALNTRLEPMGLSISENYDIQMVCPVNQAPSLLANFIEGMLAISQWEREHIHFDENTRDIVQEAEILLRTWKPEQELVRNQKIKGRADISHTFDFKLGAQYIDVISSSQNSSAAIIRKIADVTSGFYMEEGSDILVIIDDRSNPQKAQQEQTIITSLAKTILFSDLEKVAAQAITTH